MSAHGILAAIILPVAVLIDFPLALRESSLSGIGMLTVAVLAVASIGYSVFALRKKWYIHLIHLVTLQVIWAGLAVSVLIVGGH